MQMPSLLPDQLKHYTEAQDEVILLQMLVKKTSDFILFFEYACDDETWSDQHGNFMHAAIEWFTTQLLRERLSVVNIQRIAVSIQAHYSNLKSFIPRDLTFEIQSTRISSNSLLFAASSEYFHNLIRGQTYHGQNGLVSLDPLPLEFFEHIEEFVYTGDVVSIWKYDQTALLKLLRYASDVRLFGLMHLCEDTLKRYIDRDNVVNLLIKAYKKSWVHLQKHCNHFINALSWGVKFENLERFQYSQLGERKFLAFEFLEYNDRSLEVFNQVKPFVTHLIFSGSLAEDAPFSRIVKECPQMRFLDIGRIRDFSNRLYDVDPNLQELDLSNCAWLSNDYLKKMIEMFPNLRRLVLTSNVQLTFLGWSSLQKLPLLYGLDISRCRQLHDDDLLLILRACPQLTELDLEDCIGLSERAFFDLAKALPHLAVLNASKSRISDIALIEIAIHCRHLVGLYARRCKEISEKGIRQFIKQTPFLKILDVTGCNVSQEINLMFLQRF